MASDPKEYDFFRKKFYIPSIWKKDENLKKLFEEKYTDKINGFITFKKHLPNNYTRNDNWLHDYIHFFICDLLRQNKDVTFLTELDFRNIDVKYTHVFEILKNLTPDLIVFYDQKIWIVDIKVGKEENARYKNVMSKIGQGCESININYREPQVELKKKFNDIGIIEDKLFDYFNENLSLFLCEYHYWMACIKFEKIIVNDSDNDVERMLANNINVKDKEKILENFNNYCQENKESLNVFFDNLNRINGAVASDHINN